MLDFLYYMELHIKTFSEEITVCYYYSETWFQIIPITELSCSEIKIPIQLENGNKI